MKKVNEEDPVVNAVKEMSASATSFWEVLTAKYDGVDCGLHAELERTSD